MVMQIANLNLTGATVGQTGSVSWAGTNRPPTLTQTQRGQHPWLELVNMSACFLAVVVSVGSDSVPLPPGSWHVYPLSRDDTSYSFTVLTNNQNAANNTVFGWYYSADEPSPTTGQIVNQSQALAAAAQPIIQAVQMQPGTSTTSLIIGPSTTAASFTVKSVAIGFQSGGGDFPVVGVGQRLFFTITSGIIAASYLLQARSEGGYYYPLDVILPNTTPGVTTVQINIHTISGFNYDSTGFMTVVALFN